jgi:hypothetical protein
MYVVETSASTKAWTSADANSEQGLQGSSATSEEAQTDSIASGATINVESCRLIIEMLHPYSKSSYTLFISLFI